MRDKIIRKAFRQHKSMANKKKMRAARDAELNKLDKGKFSSKVKKAKASVSDRVEDFIDNTNLEDLDKSAGKAVDYVTEKAKKAGRAVGVTRDRVAKAGKWIGKNKGKAALVAAAAGGGAYAMKNKDSDQIKKIKAKDPSERTAAERRLLRLMED